jgi:hypothetical protein
VKATTPEGVVKLAAFPELAAPKVVTSLSSAAATAGSKGKESKKRGADAGAEVKEGTKKKGKGK